MPLPHPGCFIRRRVYDQIGLYDERYAVSADYDFIYRCRRAGIGRVTLDTPLVAMRLGGLAGRQRPLARKETREIALRHGRCPVLPRLAYALRTWFSR
jgi:GT2 family glycosyltransferase